MAEILTTVHEFDGDPCENNPDDHGEPVCVHGWKTIEVYVISEVPVDEIQAAQRIVRCRPDPKVTLFYGAKTGRIT